MVKYTGGEGFPVVKTNVLKQKGRRLNSFDIFLYILLTALSFFFLYPLWYCLIVSLSSGTAVQKQVPLFLPRELSLDAYTSILRGSSILLYYRNSVFYSLAGTLISLLLTSLMAYPFTVYNFKGKTFFNVFMIITMFFSGGLLPYFYLINEIGWRNQVWVMLIPGAVGAYNVVIFRTFFKNIPDSLRDAARIDGAGHYRILFTIFVPISKPLLATFGLFGLVGKWNDWFTPTLFFSKDSLLPIQSYLQTCLIAATSMKWTYDDVIRAQNVLELNLKCAVIIITIAPILCVYPFLQKYFASGALVGSIKT
jgi:putative aldouronate transport system permease protein